MKMYLLDTYISLYSVIGVHLYNQNNNQDTRNSGD